jgi:hypothetical protein
MPLTIAELDTLSAQRPPGTSLAEILGVEDVYWSASLTSHIYLLPDVLGKRAAIAPASLKGRFGG